MVFTTRRGRPRTKTDEVDIGTPELRLKHALGLTSESIDLCLSHDLITKDQHWCGLHLRWLYTLRYGAPSLTTRYTDAEYGPMSDDDNEQWRSIRETEYNRAANLLKTERRYECVMRLCVFNEQPIFLNTSFRQRAWQEPALANRLANSHRMVCEGLDLLVHHWRKSRNEVKTPLF